MASAKRAQPHAEIEKNGDGAICASRIIRAQAGDVIPRRPQKQKLLSESLSIMVLSAAPVLTGFIRFAFYSSVYIYMYSETAGCSLSMFPWGHGRGAVLRFINCRNARASLQQRFPFAPLGVIFYFLIATREPPVHFSPFFAAREFRKTCALARAINVWTSLENERGERVRGSREY